MRREVKACRRATGGLILSRGEAMSFVLVMGCGCGFLFVASFAVVLADEVAALSTGLLGLVDVPLSPLVAGAVFALTAFWF